MKQRKKRSRVGHTTIHQYGAPENGYVRLPHSLVRDNSINGDAFRILALIAGHVTDWDLHAEDIAADLGISAGTARTRMAELEAKGFLFRERCRLVDNSWTAPTWFVTLDPERSPLPADPRALIAHPLPAGQRCLMPGHQHREIHVSAGQTPVSKSDTGSDQGKHCVCAGGTHSQNLTLGSEQGKHDVSAGQSHSQNLRLLEKNREDQQEHPPTPRRNASTATAGAAGETQGGGDPSDPPKINPKALAYAADVNRAGTIDAADVYRLAARLDALMQTGWTITRLREIANAKLPTNCESPIAVIMARLAKVGPANTNPPPAAATAPPCGACDPVDRTIQITKPGRRDLVVRPCPTCHRRPMPVPDGWTVVPRTPDPAPERAPAVTPGKARNAANVLARYKTAANAKETTHAA